MVLTDRHRAILLAIAERGAAATLTGYTGSREFSDLIRHGLIVYWPPGDLQPPPRITGGYRGEWCLTFVGADAIGLPP